MPTDKEIDQFIRAIAQPHPSGMFNPWSQQSPSELKPIAYLARRKRLHHHLNCPNPRIILIGEAAGYQGCRFSGIPFTSERLLLEGQIPRMPDLKGKRLTSRTRPWSEPSATIVWGTLHALGLENEALLFNAVPWHPEGKKGALSNRTPTLSEKREGAPYLKQFMSLFPGIPVAALGNTASSTLTALDIPHRQIRHPAYGGATQFRKGLSDLVQGK